MEETVTKTILVIPVASIENVEPKIFAFGIPFSKYNSSLKDKEVKNYKLFIYFREKNLHLT